MPLSKRQKFAFAALVLFCAIIISRIGLGSLFSFRIRIAILALLSIFVSIAALKDEDFGGVEWLTLLILPTFFATACALVYPLLPDRVDSFWGTPTSPDTSLLLSLVLKMVFLAIFIVGYYAALLTSNIFNVAAVRGIQLLRVAHSIGFFVTTGTVLLCYVFIASLHLSSWANFLLIFLVSTPLTLQAVWSVNLESEIGEKVIIFSLITAIILGQAGWALSFWPLGVPTFALFLTAIFYEAVGITQYHLEGKLNRSVASEFILVAVGIFFLTFFTTVWGA